MAWTAPMTAVANTAFTAAQFNTHVRDNLLETAPAKSTGAITDGSYFVKDATNHIAARISSINSVLTSQSTSSGSFTNLSTVGPTLVANTASRCLVLWSATMYNNSPNSSYVSVAVSGATTVAASDNFSIRYRDPMDDSTVFSGSYAYMFTGLTVGSNTFTMKYRCNGGTTTFSNRHLMILPF